jgi:hypothetical protein
MSSFLEGRESEDEFISRRGNSFIRKATRSEDIEEHWDVLDKELGRVDVTAAKRKYRGGPINNTIWWELRTVKRPPNNISKPGWGVPNNVDRLIAVRASNTFYLVNPSDIIEDLRKKCKSFYRGEFGLHERPNRGDLTTILPLDYIIKNSRCIIEGA